VVSSEHGPQWTWSQINRSQVNVISDEQVSNEWSPVKWSQLSVYPKKAVIYGKIACFLINFVLRVSIIKKCFYRSLKVVINFRYPSPTHSSFDISNNWGSSWLLFVRWKYSRGGCARIPHAYRWEAWLARCFLDLVWCAGIANVHMLF